MKKLMLFMIIIGLTIVPIMSSAATDGEKAYATVDDYLANEVDKYFEIPTWEFIEFNPTNYKSASTYFIEFPITYLVSVFTYDSFGGIEKVDFDNVVFSSTDCNVAYVNELTHNIYAKGTGECTIRIEYGDLSQEILVAVGKQTNDELLRLPTKMVIEEAQENKTLRSVTREEMHQKAIDIKGYIWYADLPYPEWDEDEDAFLSVGYHWGLPYTQMAYHDEIEFEYYLSTVSEQQFYRQGYSSGKDRYFGYYGLDCSGFVSKCWQLPSRYSTGTFNANYDELSGGMVALNMGDALLRYGDALGRGDHITLVTQNQVSNEYLVMIEQTDPETAWEFYTYDQAEAEGYWPISYFYPDGD